MAIIKKIMGQITLKVVVDVVSTTYYYLLMPSAAPVPAKPTTSPPPTYGETDYEGWQTTEPGYTSGDTRSLYVTVRTVYSNGIFEYTAPSLSSSYEAAKQAYNRAQSAMTLAADTNNYFWWLTSSDDSDIPTGAYVTNIPKTTFMQNKTGGNVITQSTGITIRNGTTQLASLTGQALNFYNPQAVQGQQALQLSIGANGTLQSGNYTRGSDSKFSNNGTKIDLINGDIITKYFRVSQGLETGLSAGVYVHGTIEALDGTIGTDSTNYWEIGNGTDYNLSSTAKMIGHGSSYIQLGDSSTWRLATNRVHTGWYITNDSLLHYPEISSKYWDFGLHTPTAATEKFLYIRKSKANTSASNVLKNLLYDIDDTYATPQWDYIFYVSADGSLYAKNLYVLDENGNATQIGGTDGVYLLKSGGTMTGSITMSNGGTFIGDVTGNVSGSAAKLSNTSKIGDTNKPVYFTANGVPAAISYTIDKSVPSNAIFTDENVKSSEANTTKLWIVGSSTSGTNTGTLNYDSNVYIDTIAGALHATTYNGYTLAAASAKGVDTSMPTTATNNNVPTTLLMKTFVEGKGYLTSYTETDPTVPSWAKTSSKPSYGLTEINGTSDLQAIEALTGTSGLLKKTAADTWTLDTNSYITGITSAMVINALGFTPYDNTNPDGYTTNTGTVTSVRVQASDPLQSSTSTEQTTSLNTTISFKKQSVNTVLAGPSSGSSTAAPTFRSLVAADIPNLAWSKITSGNDDLQAIEALTGTSGLLKKTAANTWSLDTTSYVPTSRKVNGHALSSDVTVSKSDVGLGNVKNYAQITAIGQGTGGTLRVWTGDPTSTSTDDYDDIQITITAYDQSTVAKAAALDLAAAVGSTINPVYFKNDGKPYPITDGTNPITIAKSVPANAVFTDTTYIFDGTYDASSNQAATVSTVTTAIGTLNGNLNNTTPGVGKTLTAFSQTDGKISATFGNISITKSQISDFPSELTPTAHSHGNITNGGDITATAPPIANGDQLIINDHSESKITNGPTFDGSTTTKALTPKGTWETFSQFSGSYNDLDDTPTIPTVPSNIVNTITTTAGAHTAISNQKGNVSFNVPTTAAHVGIKFGYTTSGNNRAVLQDLSGNLYVIQKDDNTNYYHTTGSWGGTNNLTYTATANGEAGALAFTLATASTSVYGVTKLSSTASSTEQALAATPKLVYDSINNAINKYVTLDTNQTLTAAGTKTYLGLQTYGTNGLTLGVTSGTSVTQKANMKYDSTLEAIVFSFV